MKCTLCVYGIVAQLAAQRTKLEKHVELAKKYPNARCFKKHVKFSPKFKSKRGWNNDAIAIEKKSFHILRNKSFSLYKDMDIRESNIHVHALTTRTQCTSCKCISCKCITRSALHAMRACTSLGFTTKRKRKNNTCFVKSKSNMVFCPKTCLNETLEFVFDKGASL